MTTNLIEAAERARDALMYEIRLIEAETYTETKELIAIHCDLAAAIEAAKSVEPVAEFTKSTIAALKEREVQQPKEISND